MGGGSIVRARGVFPGVGFDWRYHFVFRLFVQCGHEPQHHAIYLLGGLISTDSIWYDACHLHW